MSSDQCSPRPSAQYNAAAADSRALHSTPHMRREFLARFAWTVRSCLRESVLDAGATCDGGYPLSNYFETWCPYEHRVMAGITCARVDCVLRLGWPSNLLLSARELAD